MKISIITPTFNSETTIAKTAESVLRQSFTEYEHIIVDNQSNDKTLDIVRGLYAERGREGRLKIICEKDTGISDAFNKGIEAASGDVVGILNSDDELYDERALARIAEALMNEKCGFVHGNIYFDDPVYGANVRRPLLCLPTDAMPFNHPTMYMKLEVYKMLGSYDLSFKYAMDFELVCRLYSSFHQIYASAYYIEGLPLIKMKAGGASWTNELDSIEELRRALLKYGMYDNRARYKLLLRKLRIIIKKMINKAGGNFLVKIYRGFKWNK